MTAKRDKAEPAHEAQLQSYIDRLDPKSQKLVRSVRSALRKRFPTANELAYDYGSSVVISYSPTDRGIDGIVAISGRATGVALYFGQGSQLPDPKGILLGAGKQARFVEVEAASRLAHPDVEALIAAATAQARIPLPSTGKGSLLIKGAAANKKRAAAKKPSRRKPAK